MGRGGGGEMEDVSYRRFSDINRRVLTELLPNSSFICLSLSLSLFFSILRLFFFCFSRARALHLYAYIPPNIFAAAVYFNVYISTELFAFAINCLIDHVKIVGVMYYKYIYILVRSVCDK